MEDHQNPIEKQSIEWLLLEEELSSSGVSLSGGAPMAEKAGAEAFDAEEPSETSSGTPEETGAPETEPEEDAAPEEAPGKKDPPVPPLFDWVSALVTAVLGVVLLFTFLVQLISVEGPSMQPTLYQGDRLLVINRLLCHFDAGDVVVVQDYNAVLSDRIIKRIVATGGQTVDIDFEQGIVYVDGEALEEPYINEPTYTEEGVSFPLTLGENEVLLMGDNRNHSTDSRSPTLGPVDRRYIVGKAVLLLAPGKNPETEVTDWGRLGLIR